MGGIKIDAAGVSLHLVRNGRGRFYGCSKNFFSEIFPSGLSLHFCTASFLGAISTPEKNFPENKKAASVFS
jgi:hypothetical protein